jgi:hypothetical protein
MTPTPSAAMADFGGRKYRQFIPFNFLLSLAAPHLHGVLVLFTGNKFIAGVVVNGDKFIAGVVVTGDNWSPVSLKIRDKDSLSPVSLTLVINIHSRISPRIFEIIQNRPNGILGCLGDTDS